MACAGWGTAGPSVKAVKTQEPNDDCDLAPNQLHEDVALLTENSTQVAPPQNVQSTDAVTLAK